eukprot:245748_1
MGGNISVECCSQLLSHDEKDLSDDESEAILEQHAKEITHIQTNEYNQNQLDELDKEIQKMLTKTPQNRSKQNKLRNKKSKKIQLDTLEHELEEAEIKLKQFYHEKQLLKHENEELRDENRRLKARQMSVETNTSIPFGLQHYTSLSPEMSPLSPVTVRITNTNITLHNQSGNSGFNPSVFSLNEHMHPITEDNEQHITPKHFEQ